MKWFIHISLFFGAFIMFLTGLEKPLNLEDATFTLAFGIDLNKQNQLIFYATSPVFGKDIKEMNKTFTARAKTSRQFRREIDKRS